MPGRSPAAVLKSLSDERTDAQPSTETALTRPLVGFLVVETSGKVEVRLSLVDEGRPFAVIAATASAPATHRAGAWSSSTTLTRFAASLAGSPLCWPFIDFHSSMVFAVVVA